MKRRTVQQIEFPPASPRVRSLAASGTAAAIALTLVTAVVGALAGCGSSQNDIRRYAIRRPNDNVEVPATATAAQTRSQAKSPPAQAAAAAKTSNLATDSPVDVSSNEQPTERAASRDAESREPLADTQSPPATPLTAQERSERTVANLERIGEAIEQHLDKNGYFPCRAVPPRAQNGLLSWRVALLPYLGYERLYSQFHLDEPWNSRHNAKLLKSIPSVYQSPERFDERTNYLLPVASGTVFSRNRGARPSAFEDGVENTALVVEVDDQLAVPWTAPREYELDVREPARNLGTLRDGAFYVLWGSGQVGRVLATAAGSDLKAMFTHDGGEPFNAGKIDQPLFAPAPRVNRLAANPASRAGETHDVGSDQPAPPEDAVASLAADYFARANALLAAGQERDAMRYFYAGVIVSPPGGDWLRYYHWVPAIRRPAPALRIGLGLDYSGPREREFDLAAGTRAGRSRRADEQWSTVTGEFGDQLVETLRSHVATCCDQSFLAAQAAPVAKKRRTNRRSVLSDDRPVSLAPAVSFLTLGRRSLIRRVAQVEEVDLLVVIDWRESQHGWSVGLELVDVVRDEELFRIPRLTSAEIDKARSHPLSQNPLNQALRQLSEFLEQQCTYRELPRRLQPRHAERRVSMLAAQHDENPLRSLSEMRFYDELGLIDAPQLLKAFQVKLDDDAGIELMIGAADAKRQTLAPWLPAPSRLTDTSTLPSSRRGNDDND